MKLHAVMSELSKHPLSKQEVLILLSLLERGNGSILKNHRLTKPELVEDCRCTQRAPANFEMVSLSNVGKSLILDIVNNRVEKHLYSDASSVTVRKGRNVKVG